MNYQLVIHEHTKIKIIRMNNIRENEEETDTSPLTTFQNAKNAKGLISKELLYYIIVFH